MKNICVSIALVALLCTSAVVFADESPLTPYQYTERASSKFMNKDINGAINDLNQAINSNPNNPELYLNRGYLKQVLKDYDGAMADYNYALKVSPNNPYAYNNRGVLKVEIGDIDGAMQDYQTSLKIKNNYSDVYYNRGNLKYMLGDNKGALEDFDKAIALNPKDADAYNNRGVVKKRMNYNVGALSDYSQAIALNPNDSIAHANRGHLKKLYYDNEGAAIDLNKAITLAENQVFIKNVRPLISRDNYITAIPVVNGITETPATIRSKKLIADSGEDTVKKSPNVSLDKTTPVKSVNNVASTTKTLVNNEREIKKTAYVEPVESKQQNNNIQNIGTTTISAAVATVKSAVPDEPKANPMVNPTTNVKLAESYYIRGLQKCVLKDLQGAKSDLDKAIVYNSKYADAYFYRGAIKKELGDNDGFKSDYSKAIKLNPSLQTFNSSNALALIH